MSGKRISISKVTRIIEERRLVCLEAAEKHAADGYANMAASERCAATELRYVLNLLFPTKDPSHD